MKERKFEVEEITVSKDEVRIKVNEETECYARELENGKIENGIGPIKKEVSEKSDAKNQKLNRKERIARRLEQIVSFGIHFLIILLLWSNPEVVEGYILMYIEISIFRIIGTSKSVKRLYEKMSKELMNKQSATMMMKNFLEKNQRLPKNFEEFKTASRMPSARAIVQNDFLDELRVYMIFFLEFEIEILLCIIIDVCVHGKTQEICAIILFFVIIALKKQKTVKKIMKKLNFLHERLWHYKFTTNEISEHNYKMVYSVMNNWMELTHLNHDTK